MNRVFRKLLVTAVASASLLAGAAHALPAPWQASAVDYNAGELRLRGAALSAEEQSQAEQAAQALGYQLRMDGDAIVLRTIPAP